MATKPVAMKRYMPIITTRISRKPIAKQITHFRCILNIRWVNTHCFVYNVDKDVVTKLGPLDVKCGGEGLIGDLGVRIFIKNMMRDV